MKFRGYTKEEQAAREAFQGRAWNVMKAREAEIRARLGLSKGRLPADVDNLDSVYEAELLRLQVGRSVLGEALEVECAAAAVALDRLQDAEAYAQIKAMRAGPGKVRALMMLEDGIKESLVFPDGFPAAQDAPRAAAA